MEFLKTLGIQEHNSGVSTGLTWLTSSGEKIKSYSPVDGKKIGTVTAADKESYEKVMQQAEAAFKHWRMVPAPKRGELVRQVGEALRQYKEPLGKLVSYEMGKVCRKEWVKCRR
jgi:aldehyde dehydrogenase (NAD+)